MKASITTNKRMAVVNVQFYNTNIKIFVREEPHYAKDPTTGENTTSRSLAKKLSVGFTTPLGLDVPARPFMKQFRMAKKEQIIQILKKAKSLGFKGMSAKQQYMWAAEQIRDLLIEFIYTGQVTPENAPYTLEHKASTSPLFDTGQLLYALDTEVTRVATK